MRGLCREIEALIDRRVSGLSDSERLVLERHLGQCVECRQLSDRMRAVLESLRAAPAALADSARERAIAGAFARVEAGRTERTAPRRTKLLRWALAAAALLASLRLIASERAPSTPAPVALAAGERARAADERARAAAAERARAESAGRAAKDERAELPSAQEWVEARAPEKRSFAQAEVELSPGSRVRFDREESALELARGRIEVGLERDRETPFVVVTQHFRVELLGTAFAVSPESVQVRRGRARVFDRQGGVLARELGRGESFTYRAPKPSAARPARAQAEPEPSATVLLERARRALASGELAEARALIERAEARKPSARDRAEAGTLRAECALLERDTALAIRLYGDVAERFAGLPAGENAAFAGAQLSARRRDDERAQRLFESYLARYPNGRFADEARARLRASARDSSR